MPGAGEAQAVDRCGVRVVRRIDTTDPDRALSLRLDVAALPAHLGRVRRRVAAWLRQFGVDADTVDDVVLATHEALANVVDHAFPSGDSGEVLVELAHDGDGGLRVVVADTGSWRQPPDDPGFRGHGMTLMAGLAQRCRVHRGNRGTTVELYWDLPVTPNAV